MTAGAVTAVLVTRPGNRDEVEDGIDRIIDSWSGLFAETVVWRNGEHVRHDWPDRFFIDGGTINGGFPDLGVYGRYAAIARAGSPVVFVQDDDCVLPRESIEAILAAYMPGKVTANMPERFRRWYPDSCLVGFGAVFDRELPAEAFSKLRRSPVARSVPASAPLPRPDVIFTALTARHRVDVPVEILPYATGTDRAYRENGHSQERKSVLRVCRDIRRFG